MIKIQKYMTLQDSEIKNHIQIVEIGDKTYNFTSLIQQLSWSLVNLKSIKIFESSYISWYQGTLVKEISDFNLFEILKSCLHLEKLEIHWWLSRIKRGITFVFKDVKFWSKENLNQGFLVKSCSVNLLENSEFKLADTHLYLI